MFEGLVLIVLVLVGVGALYGLWRLIKGFDRRAEEVEQRSAAEPRRTDAPKISEPLGPDGIVYLCAHDFVPPGAPRGVTNVRRRAYAPLTGSELEPRRMAEQIVYAVIVTHVQAGDLELRITECDPTFMPPFPHKRWALTLVRPRRLAGCPLAEAMDCALDLIKQRQAKRKGPVEEGVPLDELVEDMLKVMRQEMSFWERAGVYADIRQYLEAALIDQGYLIPAQRETLIERLRHIRPAVNEAARPCLEEAARKLAAQLNAFRKAHGSAAAAEAETVPGGRTHDVDEAIVEASPPFDDLPLHDCLKISIHEALMAIRQLEPSEDVGV